MIDLSIPEFDNNSRAKDLIIKVLVEIWPLTLKEIYNKIKKNYRYSGSYQSVFKAVNELILKKILIREDNRYEINISWIKNLQSFTDIVETNYYRESGSDFLKGKAGEDVLIMNFFSIFDCEKYLYYFVKNELKKIKSKRVLYEMDSLWKELFYMRAEYNYYTKLMKLGHEFYFISPGQSEIEKRAKNFYRKLGVKVFTRSIGSIDSIAFNDYYIQVFIPELVKKKIKLFLDEGKTFELLKILDEENSIKLVIHKDKDLVENILGKLL